MFVPQYQRSRAVPGKLWRPTIDHATCQAAASSVKALTRRRSDRPVPDWPWLMLRLIAGWYIGHARSSEGSGHRLGPMILSSNHPHSTQYYSNDVNGLRSHRTAIMFWKNHEPFLTHDLHIFCTWAIFIFWIKSWKNASIIYIKKRQNYNYTYIIKS